MTAKTTRTKRPTKKPAAKRTKKAAKRVAGKQAKITQPKGRADHLKPYRWRPGQSGNLSGRPKEGPSFRKRLRQFFASEVDPEIRAKLRRRFGDAVDDMDKFDLLVYAVGTAALKGDRHAIDVVLDRLDPKSIIEAPPVSVTVGVGVRDIQKDWPRGVDGGTDADRQ